MGTNSQPSKAHNASESFIVWLAWTMKDNTHLEKIRQSVSHELKRGSVKLRGFYGAFFSSPPLSPLPPLRDTGCYENEKSRKVENWLPSKVEGGGCWVWWNPTSLRDWEALCGSWCWSVWAAMLTGCHLCWHFFFWCCCVRIIRLL